MTCYNIRSGFPLRILIYEEYKMDFSFTRKINCEKKQARSLRAAAAVCLNNAVGGKTSIMWPADIVSEGNEVIATAACLIGEDEATLSFSVNDEYASASLAAEVEAAFDKLTAGFPDNNADIIQQYCNSLKTLMKFVDTAYRGMPVYGFAFAVDKFGGLMVMTQESRTVVTVYSGKAALAQDEPQQPDMPIMPRA